MARFTRIIAIVAVFLAPTMLELRANEGFRVRTHRAASSASSALVVPGQVIVEFHPEIAGRDAERIIAESGRVRQLRRGSFSKRYLLTLEPGESVVQVMSRLRLDPGVTIAEPNGIVRASFTPNDRFYSVQWHMKLVGSERIWDIQRGDPSVAVAILDTGIAYENFGPFRKAPDFGSTVFLQGFDFVNGDTHANDDEGHGTHVASTVAEATNNGEGVAGLAFNCALMPVKVLDFEGSGSNFDVAEGIDYAVQFTQGGQRPVKVINLSLGGPFPSSSVSAAIARAVAADVTVVAAAGNDGAGRIDYPGADANAIAVGATDGRKQRTPYSNFGPELDLMAPGGNLDRDDSGDGRPDGVLQQTMDPDSARNGDFADFAYFFFEGTSQATPHVAASAALLYQQGITRAHAVRRALETTAEDQGPAGRDNETGFGFIRPAEALKGLGLNK